MKTYEPSTSHASHVIHQPAAGGNSVHILSVRNQRLAEGMPGAVQQEVAELEFKFRWVGSKESQSSLLQVTAAMLATEHWWLQQGLCIVCWAHNIC